MACTCCPPDDSPAAAIERRNKVLSSMRATPQDLMAEMRLNALRSTAKSALERALADPRPKWRLQDYVDDKLYAERQFQLASYPCTGVTWLSKEWIRRLHLHLGEAVAAYAKEPDRIDLLGEVYELDQRLARITRREFVPRALRPLTVKFPQLLAYEDAREQALKWKQVAWVTDLPPLPGHMVHASVEDPTKVAFTKSVKDLISDRQTRMTAGKYLRKYYPHLSDAQVKAYAEKHHGEYAEVEVKFARSESEVVRVIGDGPSDSCMSNRFYDSHRPDNPWYDGEVHPAAVYGYDEEDDTWDTDIEVLYFEVGGEVKGRVVCNKLSKECARIYGDETRLLPAIEALGYCQREGALVGARIRHIRSAKGHIMAYVDAGIKSGGGYLHYESHGSRHWWLHEEGTFSTYLGYEDNGVASDDPFDHIDEDDTVQEEGTTCDRCGDVADECDLTQVHEGDFVCDFCLGRYYVEVASGAFVMNEDAVFCRSDREYYHVDDLRDNSIEECAVTGECYFTDDMYETDLGLVCVDHAVRLDEDDDEGFRYASSGRVSRTEDGRILHRDMVVKDMFTKCAHGINDDELIRWWTSGGMGFFTVQSMVDNIDNFALLGDTVILTWGKFDRGAIPLVDYLKVSRDDEWVKLRYESHGHWAVGGPVLEAMGLAKDVLTSEQSAGDDTYKLAA